MNLINTWNPIREMEALQNHLLRAFHQNTHPSAGSDSRQSLTTTEWTPTVDISEDANQYLIKAELPEVKREDVKVTVENGVLTLKGERLFEKDEKDTKYHRIERSYGSFMRSFTMPDDADADKVTAEFKDGVLHVKLPKSEAKKPRQIEVLVN
jgi:HSP20 family protein